MPSFNRLLVLTVLALSASVQSALADTNYDYGVVPTKDGLTPTVHTPSVPDQFYKGDVSVDLDARDFDEDSGTEEDDNDFKARDLDGEDTDIENETVDTTGDDSEDMTLDRRAAAKTTAARKPTTTKAAAPETTKARPTKATKTGKPAKASKGSPKPSKTTKAAGTAKPSACPVKKPAKKPRAVTSRAYDYIVHLFARDNEEFIGWHGTNSDTAALWAKKGYFKKPTGPLDYIPWKKEGAGKGTSGANAELGPGLYLADDRGSSITFSHFNVGKNPKTKPMLCAIFAKSSGNWRNSIHKAFIPEDIVGHPPDLEKARVEHIKEAVPGVAGNTVVRFALLDRDLIRTSILALPLIPCRCCVLAPSGQMLIPESLAKDFSAKCFKVDGNAVAEDDAAASHVGTKDYPDFQYDGATLRDEWKIVPENVGCD